ncbi:arginine/lysine/ornithine decarboxylase [Streptomyces sp. SAI-117]|nr:arginine/lysine/ornithine decarboxylase [Streptomyces sp. SAI-117]
MTVDHTRAPVLEALADYHRRGQLSFAPPGHKQARGADPAVREVLGDAVFLGDVLASGGLDDRLTRGRVLERAEELMADAVHADHTFFTTCGSSLSVKAAMLAVAGPHEKLLIGRDAHKSVVSGLILSGIEPVWVEPRWDAERHLAHPPSAAEYEQAFEAHPDAKGALVTSPTPYGTCAALEDIAEVCHRRSVPLIVDEAWGAHLPFHPDLPSWAMDAGADICVTSIHKMGSGLEQGSVFHLRGDLVPPDLLKMRADLLGTTSPSVLLYAGLDGWRRQMALRGKELMGGALDLASRVRAAIEEIDGMHVNDRDDFCGPGLADDLDPLPGVIDLAELGISGFQAPRTGCTSTGTSTPTSTTTGASGCRSPTATTRRRPTSCWRRSGTSPGPPRGWTRPRGWRCRPRPSCGWSRRGCPGTRSSGRPRTCPWPRPPGGSRPR